MASNKKYENLLEKFEDGYESQFLGNDNCWNWTKGLTAGGYGQITYECKKYAPHRLAWEFANNKKIDKGMVIMHSCDNPACVNPKHLSMATQAENVADMMQKGRFKDYDKSGENNPRSIVKKEDVKAIFEADGTHQEIADKFGYPYHAVSSIRIGRNWKVITKGLVKGARGKSGAKGSKNGKATVDEFMVADIFKASGRTVDIARLHFCSENTVHGIKSGRTWSDITSGLTKG